MLIQILVKTFVKLTIIILAVIIITLSINANDNSMPNVPPLLAQRSTTAIRTAVLEQLRSINELHTCISSIQTVVTSEQSKELLGLEVGSTKLLYVAVGQVRAGIDLSQLNEDSVSVDGDAVIIMLPSSQILDSKIDINRSFVYDVQHSLAFAPDALIIQAKAQQDALREVERDAVECGILDMANDQAKLIVESLVKMAGVARVRVEIEKLSSPKSTP